MKNISLDELDNVTGAGLSSRGTPIYGKPGCYEQQKNIGGQLHSRTACFPGGTSPWVRTTNSYPNYDGDSTAGAPQG